jgi:O-antigen/teichoic acid export membrane protein
MTGPLVERERSIRGAVATSAVGKAAEMVTLLLLATVVPRALGPTDYGRFAVPLTIVTLGSLALTLGGHTVMARYVPAAPPGDRVGLARALGARLAWGRAVTLAALVGLGVLAVVVAPDRFPASTTAIVLVSLVLSVVATLALQVTLGLGRAGPWSARYPLQNAVLIAAVLALGGHELAILLSVVAALVFAAVSVAPAVRGPADRVAIPGGAIRFGVFLAAGAGLVQVAQRGSVLAVAVLGGSDRQTAYAALATGIALGVTYAVLQAYTVALPHLAEEDRGEATLRRLTRLLLVASIVATLPAALLLQPLVEAVFGQDFAGAVAAFGPALAIVVLAPIHALLVQVAALRLEPEASLAGGIAVAAGFVVTAVVAIPALGAAGGTLAVLVGTAAGVLELHRRLPGAADLPLLLGSLAGAGVVAAVAAW